MPTSKPAVGVPALFVSVENALSGGRGTGRESDREGRGGGGQVVFRLGSALIRVRLRACSLLYCKQPTKALEVWS